MFPRQGRNVAGSTAAQEPTSVHVCSSPTVRASKSLKMSARPGAEPASAAQGTCTTVPMFLTEPMAP